MNKNPQTNRSLADGVKLKSERNKLIVMSVVLVFVVIAFFATQMQEDKHRQEEMDVVGEEPPFNPTVTVEKLDLTPLEGKIHDKLPDDRVLLPAEVLDPFVKYTNGFSDRHFAALETKVLDGDAVAALEADPAAHRGESYRVRGFLEDMKHRERPDGLREYKGWLRLETGGVAHFVITDLVDDAILDDFMRIDGLFVKLYRREGHQENWEEGPLFVGSRAVRSYSTAGPHDPELLSMRLRKIADDTATSSTGLDSDVFAAEWLLINYALGEATEEVDWEAAPVLDNAFMTQVLMDGAEFRGQPMQIPISQNMGMATVDPGENSSRLDLVTEGWIGNTTWTNQAKVIKFLYPGEFPKLEVGDLVRGRGFFIKNHNYEPSQGGVRQAPYFVLADLETFTPPENNLAKHLMWGAAGLALLLVMVFPVLLLRDRRKSEALQRDLVRRKQERRERLAKQAQP